MDLSLGDSLLPDIGDTVPTIDSLDALVASLNDTGVDLSALEDPLGDLPMPPPMNVQEKDVMQQDGGLPSAGAHIGGTPIDDLDPSMLDGIGITPNGALKLSPYVFPCNQPPFMTGCKGMGRMLGGSSDKGRRFTAYCTECGKVWNQLRPDLIGPDGDPQAVSSNRAVNLTDKRRSNGYNCDIRKGGCGRKLNRKLAKLTGEEPCNCKRRTDKSAPSDVLPLPPPPPL